jgi:hypothetical protein
MDRRNALKSLVVGAGALFIPSRALALPTSYLFDGRESATRFGWRSNPDSLSDFIERNRYPYLNQQNKAIEGTGKGQKAFLHLALERTMGGPHVAHDQGAPDCVSQAAGLGVDVLSAVQIAIQRAPQKWIAKAATEPIYGGSRVEIAGYNGAGGGSTGHWAAEWLQKYGVLMRQKYPGGYDYTTYDARKAVELGRKGCPDSLEPIAKLHPVKHTAICRSYSELRDCLFNGSPVMVCSNVGFGNGVCERDSEGFLRRRRWPWYHAMLFAGYDDTYRRPGALCFNSWGDEWIKGPTRGPMAAGTFWIDASTVDSMLGQGDSFAFSAFQGFPRVNIPPYVLR